MPFCKNQQQQVDSLKSLVGINQDTRILDLGYNNFDIFLRSGSF